MTTSVKRILVPIDFGPTSEAALYYAKRLATRLVHEGELSEDPTLEASEQPDRTAALATSAATPRGPRVGSRSLPGPIETTQLFHKSRFVEPYTNQFVAAPRPALPL